MRDWCECLTGEEGLLMEGNTGILIFLLARWDSCDCLVQRTRSQVDFIRPRLRVGKSGHPTKCHSLVLVCAPVPDYIGSR